ncbi:MAG TPA: 2-C-methyl-D-erythritol 4-phosphate cytidylyltransferase [bacterium]|nr:2-C-methyl-D-erythritol 4-phosphate cytidylyltransferase [bacterium]
MNSGRSKAREHGAAWAAALVLAAGAGKRLGAGRKGLLLLDKLPLYAWSVRSFLAQPWVGQVVLVVHASDVRGVSTAAARRFKDPRVRVVAGGAERQDSVAKGLQVLDAHLEVVMVHDAARPFLKSSLVKACALAARHTGGGVACVPVKDSIKRIEEGVLTGLPREGLAAAQTPQAFQAHLLREAHATAAARGLYYTDEAGLCEAAGIPAVAVSSYNENFKITTPEDLLLAKRIIKTFDFS